MNNKVKIWQTGEQKTIFDNHDDVKKWSKKHYQFWRENLLSKEEKNLLKRYSDSKYDGKYLKSSLTNFLNEFEGNLNPPQDSKYREFESKKNLKIADLIKKIQWIDQSLKKTTIPEKIKIYSSPNKNFFTSFGQQLNELTDSFENDKIDRQRFLELKVNLISSIVVQYSYIDGFLLKNYLKMKSYRLSLNIMSPKIHTELI